MNAVLELTNVTIAELHALIQLGVIHVPVKLATLAMAKVAVVRLLLIFIETVHSFCLRIFFSPEFVRHILNEYMKFYLIC